MNVVIGAKTDPGRRPNNEDRYAVLDARSLSADGVLIIADGMGGRRMGERAATAAVETVQETLTEALSKERAAQADTSEALVSALRKANARVYEMSQEGGEGRGMGTTCVAAVVLDDNLFIAHAGDSRAYLLRSGQLEQLTDDHSYVAEQVRAGAITEEGARQSRFRNVITRAVGIEPTLAPDVTRHAISLGNVLLLCTDGLSNMVSEGDMAQTLEYAPSPQAAAERLVQLAIRAGGKDNITAVVGRFEIGNSTQQMRTEDLAAPPPQERPVSPAAPKAPARVRKSTPSGFPIWPILAGIAIFLLAILGAGLAHVLVTAGYQLQPAPPFAVRPVMSSAKPPLADLAHLTYAPPVLFYVKPVQGGFLSLNPSDGTITAITLDSRVAHLSPIGAVLSLSALPKLKTVQDAAAMPIFAADGDQHVATDPQGNIYIAEFGNRAILKYDGNLKPLGRISGLSGPGALAVASDGTIYVIDGERLKVLRPIITP
jgi:serine/threonine protein phosphatase PrpC